MSPIKTVVAGGLVAGLLDIIYAVSLFAVLSNGKPMRIGQGIASHVIGQGAFDGGWTTAALGFGLHFAIVVVMALVFYVGCRLFPLLARHPLAFAPLYGLGLYFIMSFVIAPLTNTKPGFVYPHFPPALGFELYRGLFAHIVLVALTLALFTKHGLRQSRADSDLMESDRRSKFLF